MSIVAILFLPKYITQIKNTKNKNAKKTISLDNALVTFDNSCDIKILYQMDIFYDRTKLVFIFLPSLDFQ